MVGRTLAIKMKNLKNKRKSAEDSGSDADMD